MEGNENGGKMGGEGRKGGGRGVDDDPYCGKRYGEVEERKSGRETGGREEREARQNGTEKIQLVNYVS